ncbi:hypothetical protein QZH56_36495 [Streptomyces olivoreticuli]|uniref:hypothetical protein n=1 Tax=Streptomyces olivoreticuli TaxID=68246 RepID=UPI0026585595|nr:hypothetical protein [Streptomyces olivoreticuli]WKK24094.1 hypothetical protein QZH56_36495 [Streptomyces olivoreticuli]
MEKAPDLGVSRRRCGASCGQSWPTEAPLRALIDIGAAQRAVESVSGAGLRIGSEFDLALASWLRRYGVSLET